MKIVFNLFVFIVLIPLNAIAVSFSADAVQVRNGDFSHARMFWTDDQVRFDYLDQGVSIAQIYDTTNKKIIWLDTENKVYLERELSEGRGKQKVVNKSLVIKSPCELFVEAECKRLKETVVNGRKTVKWLVTLVIDNSDMHVFQWIDKKYGVVIKQENPDGSILNSTIEEGLEVNGRKARKVDVHAVSKNGKSMRNVQWYDNELDVVIRQVFSDGSMDELRNIKVEKIASSLFSIPKGYSEVEQQVQEQAELEQPEQDQPDMATQPEAFKFIETQTN